MNLDINSVILSLAGIAVGLIIGIFFQKGKNSKILESTRLEANDILRNAKQKAERIKDEKMLY
jgi:preprotein translocase subunit SecG